MKLDQKVQIDNYNAKTNHIDQLIGKSQDFEFLVNPAKELSEIFCRNPEFLNRAKCI